MPLYWKKPKAAAAEVPAVPPPATVPAVQMDGEPAAEQSGVASAPAAAAPAVPLGRSIGHCPSCGARLWEGVQALEVYNCPNTRSCGRRDIQLSEVVSIEAA